MRRPPGVVDVVAGEDDHLSDPDLGGGCAVESGRQVSERPWARTGPPRSVGSSRVSRRSARPTPHPNSPIDVRQHRFQRGSGAPRLDGAAEPGVVGGDARVGRAHGGGFPDRSRAFETAGGKRHPAYSLSTSRAAFPRVAQSRVRVWSAPTTNRLFQAVRFSYIILEVSGSMNKRCLSERPMDATNEASFADAGNGLPFWFEA